MIGTTYGRRPARLLALAPIVLMACSASAQLSGAIQTTFEDGTTVNGNIYPSKDKVFLNGGPQNQNAAGLMNGVYFFQVTNPNGHVLLSTTNAMDRLVKVTNGRFAGRCKPDGTLLDNPVSPHRNAASVNPANGSLGVQLAPFLDTPNNGGEYKAWVMLRKLDGSSKIYAEPASDNIHVNFLNRYAKTDNFKVKEPFTDIIHFLQGTKFFDFDMDGVKDPEDAPIGGFVIKIVLNGGNPIYVTTDATGTWTYGPISASTTYKVCEVLPPDSHYNGANASTKWIQTAPGTMNDPTDERCYEGTANGPDANIDGLDFGNTQVVKLSGIKFYDRNLNGTKDSGEELLKNWQIKTKITYPDGFVDTDTILTDDNGAFEIKDIPIGSSYEVSEVNKTGWLQTGPAGNLYSGSITVGAGPYTVAYNQADVSGLDFGNILVAPIKGVKFRDANMNGDLDSGEERLQGFTIHISGTTPDGKPFTDSAVTDSNGAFKFGPYPDGTTYSITEDVPAGWKQTTPSPVTGTINATLPVTASSLISDVIVNVGNIKIVDIKGHKFYDKNYNGAKDSGEALLAGFTINITGKKPDGSSINESTTTDSNGAYSFGPYPEGTTYSITENVPAGWKQTTTSPITGTLGDKDATDLDIGNILMASIKGVKFYDYNMNKAKDGTEPVLAGFTIKISYTLPNGQSGSDSTVTGNDGAFSFGPFPDGTSYSITETVPSGWLQTTSSPATGTLNAGSTITINTVLADATVNVGNIKLARLKGCKWYDTNGNGNKDSGEPGIQGFKIVISYTKPNGTTGTETIYTDSSGNWQSKLYPEGTTYTVKEVMPPTGNWKQTYPAAPGTYSGTIKGNSTPTDNTYTVPDVTGLKFGNRVCPIINAHTKGYWHNQNGYATMNDGGTIVPELTMLNNLPLVRLNGSAADFNTANPSAGFTDFSNWITNDSNGSNMACQLSAQLAAMKLNVEAGFVSGSQLLYAPGTSSANSLGIATLDDLMNEAIAALIANPLTVNASAARTKQNAIMTALDKGNNNLNWLSLPIIIVPSPY